MVVGEGKKEKRKKWKQKSRNVISGMGDILIYEKNNKIKLLMYLLTDIIKLMCTFVFYF